MNNRKNQDLRGKSLPDFWLDEVRKTFNQTYSSECQKQLKSFDVHAETHKDEFVMAVSFLSPDNPERIPVTYLISADLGGNEPSKKMLDALIDSAGIFFDQYFATPDWNEYFSEWTEGEVRGFEFHYVVSRDNVRLTHLADDLLNDN